MAPRKILAKNIERSNKASTKQGPAKTVESSQSQRLKQQPGPRLKLEIRRLPPGLTVDEFDGVLGQEWTPGHGKIDYRDYRQGKVRPTGTGKAPEQSRCYLHIVSEPLIHELEKRFFEATWQDQAGTYKHADLVHLPPVLGFALSQRTPNLTASKQRIDPRQGTIDQDPEYIAFLESDALPIVKPAALDLSQLEKESKDVKSTLLIEDLRLKKASKARGKTKDKAAKGDKKQKDNHAKAADGQLGKKAARDNGKEDGTTHAGKRQQQRQAGKVAKSGAKVQSAEPVSEKTHQTKSAGGNATSGKGKRGTLPDSPKSSPDNASATQSEPVTTNSRRERQRGNADGIKKLVQKDLGLRPKDEPNARSDRNEIKLTSALSTPETAVASPHRVEPAKKNMPKVSKATTSSATPKSSSIKAYLKNVHASQGMSEALVRTALSQFGLVNSVNVDLSKNTGIVVFKDDTGLRQALRTRQVSVAEGTVEVLEYKEKSSGSSRTGHGKNASGSGGRSARRGKGGGGRGERKDDTASVAGQSNGG